MGRESLVEFRFMDTDLFTDVFTKTKKLRNRRPRVELVFYFFCSTPPLLDSQIKTFILFSLLILNTESIGRETRDLFIIWDVGQGSWSTAVEEKFCVHFDMGGQKAPPREALLYYCGTKKNYLALTHLDKDHIRFIKKFASALRLCLITKKSFPKNKAVQSLKSCNETPYGLHQVMVADFLERNDSHVYLWNNTALITGDLPRRGELRLIPKLRKNKIRFFLAGHHGSKTSSHPQFVRRLIHLEQVLISAKKYTYGHPHEITRKTFKKSGVPLVETQHFGSLIFEH